MMSQHSHPSLEQWLSLNYPKPQLCPDWLDGFSQWLLCRGISPDSDFQSYTGELESQLLSSDLHDSTLQGTGLPLDVTLNTTNTVLTDLILVEIASITEIAHSAFNLEQIRAAREERERLGRLVDVDDDGDIEIDEGPPPKYPSGMFKFKLTDGSTSLPAIEYRPLPEIKLGVTPLGYKLKNVKIRNGIAWLEPETVIMKGYSTETREVLRKFEFARGLRERMRLPLEPIPQSASPSRIRPPLEEISPPPPPPPPRNDDELLESRRRRKPENKRGPPIDGAFIMRENATSPYFMPSISQIGIPSVRQSNSHVPKSTRQQQIIAEWGEAIRPFVDQTRQEPRINHSSRRSDVKGKWRATEDYNDDEFDENIFIMDQAFLESLERVESEAMQSVTMSKEPTPTLLPSTAGPAAPSNIASYRTTTQGVIEIVDDEDCEDKENMPIATRHVRRRTDSGTQEFGLAEGRLAISGDVIDLSDSD